jgi:hypothetical protein
VRCNSERARLLQQSVLHTNPRSRIRGRGRERRTDAIFPGDQNLADVSAASEKLPYLRPMKPNREKIEAEELVKERLPLTKWELTPKEKEDFNRVMRLMFDAASILRYDLELGEDAIGKTLKELADWATN